MSASDAIESVIQYGMLFLFIVLYMLEVWRRVTLAAKLAQAEAKNYVQEIALTNAHVEIETLRKLCRWPGATTDGDPGVTIEGEFKRK